MRGCYLALLVFVDEFKKEEDIPEPPATVMLLVILILSFPLAIYGLYCFIRAILIKQTSYKCRYCKNRFHDPFAPTVIK
jgi:hypothetical protein